MTKFHLDKSVDVLKLKEFCDCCKGRIRARRWRSRTTKREYCCKRCYMESEVPNEQTF